MSFLCWQVITDSISLALIYSFRFLFLLYSLLTMCFYEFVSSIQIIQIIGIQLFVLLYYSLFMFYNIPSLISASMALVLPSLSSFLKYKISVWFMIFYLCFWGILYILMYCIFIFLYLKIFSKFCYDVSFDPLDL